MSLDLETALAAALQAQCPRTSPMVAPVDTALPYITWQHIGGVPVRYADNAAGNRRMVMVQVNVWAATVAAALLLIRQVEDALCASAVFTARPLSEPIGQHEADFARYGFIQDFEIVGDR